MELNLNQNSVECIKEVSNIGHTVFQNICTGASNIVYWGVLDWLAGIMVFMMLGLVIVALGWMVVSLIRD